MHGNSTGTPWEYLSPSTFHRTAVTETIPRRYRGVAKNQFAAFLQALAFNLKRLVVLDADLVAA